MLAPSQHRRARRNPNYAGDGGFFAREPGPYGFPVHRKAVVLEVSRTPVISKRLKPKSRLAAYEVANSMVLSNGLKYFAREILGKR
jgi:hypothetical protein